MALRKSACRKLRGMSRRVHNALASLLALSTMRARGAVSHSASCIHRSNLQLHGTPTRMRLVTQKPIAEMTLAEIADEICHRLQLLDKDRKKNPTNSKGGKEYFHQPVASRRGRVLKVRYVHYHTPYTLSQSDAGAYLQWLRQGNVGWHFEALPPRGGNTLPALTLCADAGFTQP